MIRLSLLIATAAFGSDVGWQPLPEGGTEYIIQLGPHELDALRRGRPFESDVPRSAGEVRAYRIVVGTAILPHEAPPPRSAYRAEPGRRWTDVWPAPLAEPEDKARAGQPAPRGAGLSGNAGSTVGQANRDTHAGRESRQVSSAEPAAKPWLWLTVTLMGLFASLGSNLFLGWIALDLRRRCRRLMPGRAGAAARGDA
jgi:hypothetical protein